MTRLSIDAESAIELTLRVVSTESMQWARTHARLGGWESQVETDLSQLEFVFKTAVRIEGTRKHLVDGLRLSEGLIRWS